MRANQKRARKGPAYPPMNALGAVIDKRINELGTNQAEFAEQCDISESALSLVRRGKRTNLKGETLFKLAKGLGITVDDLLSITRAGRGRKSAARATAS